MSFEEWPRVAPRACSPMDEIVTSRVAQVMWERYVSTLELATLTGLKESTIRSKLTGFRPWSMRDVRRVAVALEVPVRDLFPSVDDEFEAVMS